MSASAASARCVVGSPEKVADDIETWFDETDVDGFNVPFAVSPGDFADITDMLVPELTRRGRYKSEYRQGTLREKLFGEGRARLDAPHPATTYRRAGGRGVTHRPCVDDSRTKRAERTVLEGGGGWCVVGLEPRPLPPQGGGSAPRHCGECDEAIHL